MTITRRGIIGAIICAPAIVRASSLMPIKAFKAAAGDDLWYLNVATPLTERMVDEAMDKMKEWSLMPLRYSPIPEAAFALYTGFR